MSKVEAIDQVQSAEAEAKQRIEKANSSKLSRIDRAREEASSIINEALEKAKASRIRSRRNQGEEWRRRAGRPSRSGIRR